MIDVSELLTDPDLATTFERVRAGGSFTQGRWVDGAPVTTSMVGVVQPATAQDKAEFLPEGERSSDMIRVWCAGDIRKSDGETAKADLINWQGNQYRVVATKPWQQNGYVQAWAVGIGAL